MPLSHDTGIHTLFTCRTYLVTFRLVLESRHEHLRLSRQAEAQPAAALPSRIISALQGGPDDGGLHMCLLVAVLPHHVRPNVHILSIFNLGHSVRNALDFVW